MIQRFPLILLLLVIKLVSGYRVVLPSSLSSSSTSIYKSQQHNNHLLYNNNQNIEQLDNNKDDEKGHGILKHMSNIITTAKKTIVATVLMASSINVPLKQRRAILGGTRYVINYHPVIIINFNDYHSAIVATMGGPQHAHASIFKRYTSLSPYQKLATTPLFFVTNSMGSPYLQEDLQAGKPDQRIVVYFMSSEDANDYLNEMAQGSPQNINEFRVTATSMEKIVKKIQNRKQSRKLGRFPMSNVFRIQPSSRQCENADKLLSTGKSNKAPTSMAIPVFTAKGMVMKRPNGEVVTPYYFAYEDLLEDWEELMKEKSTEKANAVSDATTKSTSNAPKVVVKDLTEILTLSKGMTFDKLVPPPPSSSPNPEVKAVSTNKKLESGLTEKEAEQAILQPGIIPPRREIAMLKRYYRNQAGLKNEFQASKIIGAK